MFYTKLRLTMGHRNRDWDGIVLYQSKGGVSRQLWRAGDGWVIQYLPVSTGLAEVKTMSREGKRHWISLQDIVTGQRGLEPGRGLDLFPSKLSVYPFYSVGLIKLFHCHLYGKRTVKEVRNLLLWEELGSKASLKFSPPYLNLVYAELFTYRS